jgi:hypothetical protein
MWRGGGVFSIGLKYCISQAYSVLSRSEVDT